MGQHTSGRLAPQVLRRFLWRRLFFTLWRYRVNTSLATATITTVTTRVQCHIPGDTRAVFTTALPELVAEIRRALSARKPPADPIGLRGLLRWVCLCATVKRPTVHELNLLVAYVEAQLLGARYDLAVNSHFAQNWYLDPSIGQVDTLRQQVMEVVPVAVGSSGAGGPIKRVAAKRSARPGLSSFNPKSK